MEKCKVALALGGGAARGLAHIGVLYELESAGIQVDLIVGSSVGALVGALYSIQPSAKFVEEQARRFLTSKNFRMTKLEFLKKREEGEPSFFYNLKSFMMKGVFLTSSVTRKSFVDTDSFERGIELLVDGHSFDDLKIPFSAVAADIQSGEEVILQSGRLLDAILASSAIPGIFPPVEMEGRVLVDGGWVSPVPVSAARRLGASSVIGVDISREIDDTAELERGLNIILRTNAITRQKLKDMELRDADVVIRPDVGSIHWADFTKMYQCIELGREATKAKIADINKLRKKGLLSSILPRFIK